MNYVNHQLAEDRIIVDHWDQHDHRVQLDQCFPRFCANFLFKRVPIGRWGHKAWDCCASTSQSQLNLWWHQHQSVWMNLWFIRHGSGAIGPEAIFIPLQIGKNSDLLVLKPLHKHIVSATSPIGSHSFFVLLPIWFFQHPPTIGRRHFLAQSPSSFETAERAWRTGSENSFWKSCCFNRKEGKEQGYKTRAGRTCKVICHQIFSDWSEGKDTHRMEETQCSNFLYKKCLKNFPIGFGNGNHTTYKNGDLGDGLLLFYPHAYLGYIWYMDFRRCVSSVLYVMAWGPSNRENWSQTVHTSQGGGSDSEFWSSPMSWVTKTIWYRWYIYIYIYNISTI